MRFAPLIVVAAAASCGSDNDRKLDQMALTSSGFQNGQPIPAQYTCDRAEQPPPLAWGEPPTGTKSFALVLDDPDAPGGTFRHWGAYDIPANARSTGAGAGAEAVNDMNQRGYAGPCPPKDHGPHHYHFKLYALSVARLELPPNAKVKEVEREAQRHAIASSELVGTYERR